MSVAIATQVVDTIVGTAASPLDRRAAVTVAALQDELRRRLHLEFAVFACPEGRLLPDGATTAQIALDDDHAWLQIVADGEPRIEGRGTSKAQLYVPLGSYEGEEWLAVARLTAADSHDVRLASMAGLVAEKFRGDAEQESLRAEVRKLSEHIGSTFEEITLIYRLTRNLSISRKPTEIGEQALEWLEDVVPAEGFAIFYDSTYDASLLSRDDAQSPMFLTRGRVPLGIERFVDLLDRVRSDEPLRAVVRNNGVDDSAADFATVREFVLAPLHEGERRFGWVAAFNHTRCGEFGSGEAGLLASIGAILGMHCGNVDLYEQQAELFSGVVRAMSSAIDAKDPYTHGHSDRVARVAVRIAQELGCDAPTLRTIYMAGLLHDVGKIGIDDNVLRKPGKLTEAEYEHIKAHVEIGYRILRGLKKMGHVLPIVLHHHESWDGKGYPFGLQGTNIPYLARIVSVADAYDAMSSDRPYRKGMEDEKLDAIFRAGAGKQWDPEIVDAFFRARDDIRQISLRRPDPIDAVAVEWTH